MFLSHCHSYEVSLAILSHYKKLKFSDNTEDMETLLKSLCQQAKLAKNTDKNRLDLMILAANSTNLKAKGFNFGSHEAVSTNGNAIPPNQLSLEPDAISEAFFGFSLARGEKVVCFSSGLKANYCSTIKKDNIKSFALQLIHNERENFLENMFSAINKNERGLKHDASCITIEVDKNALFKI